MKRILDFDSRLPIFEASESLPAPGQYHAVIVDVDTYLISPFEGSPQTCLVVGFKLANVDTLETCLFYETYFPDEGNARSEDFLAFLQANGCTFTSDCDMLGLKANVCVTYEFLSGYAHPIISFRQWGRQPTLLVYSDEDIPL